MSSAFSADQPTKSKKIITNTQPTAPYLCGTTFKRCATLHVALVRPSAPQTMRLRHELDGPVTFLPNSSVSAAMRKKNPALVFSMNEEPKLQPRVM